MEVSHFELIYKPQAPIGPGGVGAVDTVLQGYFLEITNLEAEEYRYRVEFVAVPPAAGVTERSLEGNTLVFIDTPGVNNAVGILNGAFTDTSFFPSQGDIAVQPHATALVAVLPSVFGSIPTVEETPIPTSTETFEVRGYVRISLPALDDGTGVLEPQASHPVRVMLTPQNRTVYYRRTALTGVDVTTISDQTQTTLMMAGGKGRVRLRPEPGGAALVAVSAAARRVPELA